MKTIDANTMRHILMALERAEQKLRPANAPHSVSDLGKIAGEISFARECLMEAAISDVSVEPQPALAESAT